MTVNSQSDNCDTPIKLRAQLQQHPSKPKITEAQQHETRRPAGIDQYIEDRCLLSMLSRCRQWLGASSKIHSFINAQGYMLLYKNALYYI
jgi:hypothetical protein